MTLEAAILRKLALMKHDSVAKAIGHDASHVSRIATGERGIRLGELEAFLREMGLVVVEIGQDGVTPVPNDELRALKVFAKKGFDLIGLGD